MSGRSTITCSLTVGGSIRRRGSADVVAPGAWPVPRLDRRARRRRGRPDANAADGAGSGIDVPRPARSDDHPGAGRQRDRGGAGKEPGLALHQPPATGMPARLTALRPARAAGHRPAPSARRCASRVPPRIRASVAGRRSGLLVGGDLARASSGSRCRCARRPAASRRYRRTAARRAPVRTPSRCRSAVVSGSATSASKKVCCSGRRSSGNRSSAAKRGRGQMGAGPDAAGAVMVEHHPAPEPRGRDAHPELRGAVPAPRPRSCRRRAAPRPPPASPRLRPRVRRAAVEDASQDPGRRTASAFGGQQARGWGELGVRIAGRRQANMATCRPGRNCFYQRDRTMSFPRRAPLLARGFRALNPQATVQPPQAAS